MPYEYITAHTSPNRTPAASVPKVYGRKRTIESITIHHWGNLGQKFQSVVNYLCRKGGSSSAHEVIEAGRVACIVPHADAAWHSGTATGNATSIGLELRPEATDEDYATAAERIRDLREVYGDVPLRPHSSWKATACPGKWDLARLDALARTGVVSSPASKPAAPAAPAPPTGPRLAADGQLWVDEDGYLGPATIARWQQIMGTPIDGVISRPSTLIRAVQARVRATADGYLGPKTVRAIQRHLGTPQDGVISKPSTMVKALQKRLNAATF